MKKLLVLLFLTGIILTVSLVGLNSLEENKESGEFTLTIVTIGSTTNEELTANGDTLLDILKDRHAIKGETKLECIDEVCNKGGFWWQFYVNDKIVLNTVY